MKRFTLALYAFAAALTLHAQETPDTTRFLTGMEDLVAALQDTTSHTEAADTAVLPLFPEGGPAVTVIPAAPQEAVRDFGGITWYTYDFDGIQVAAGLRFSHDYGRYYLADIHILNTTREALNFDFDAIRMSAGDGSPIRVFTHDEYLRRVRSRQNWAHFGTQIALLPLHIIAIALADNAFDDDFSLGESLMEGLTYAFIDTATDIGSTLIAAHYGAEANRVYEENLGYMRDCLIRPDSSVSGHFFARFDPHAREILLDLPLNGKTYRMSFLTIGLPEVRRDN